MGRNYAPAAPWQAGNHFGSRQLRAVHLLSSGYSAPMPRATECKLSVVPATGGLGGVNAAECMNLVVSLPPHVTHLLL